MGIAVEAMRRVVSQEPQLLRSQDAIKSKCHVCRGGRVAGLPTSHKAGNEVVVALSCCYCKLQQSSLSGHS